ncbi:MULTISPECIES: polyprenyl synthetase family protein [Streptomyces]|uniref:Polyprenyl synthetase family protein n=1 Tax=Streptomyces glycanivorans TaxID=3033808 RepID=A0ABY9J3J7_9ACTN|nr:MULTISPECIES: polyprenyl synthetase family protein [unclassified Streptomyces]WSQ75913.1 polyprenyl synthetase family protein [Streptomyces sp. NBC_01213]TXS12441.1 polyprenyl synthetase family protein [Streptomyces sp. wa22]WLQ62405.1 polyprenyl synthetase family protein [Streptomyces sp. Alt3]WSQ83160.1 polyprenyl synthetase family protein [Streptomyces sp. NBC_01212]WSR10810.1 polyprenyl synthetase family protein [Streptomyces sp. NBC_01208]
MTHDRWDPAEFKARVDGVLRRFVAQEAERFAAVDPALGPVAEQLESSVAHGKRLRAAFCYWGWRATGQPDDESLVRAAASMELVHAAAVVHDDLIDDSPLRHGRPTAHIALRGAVRRRPRSVSAGRSLAMLVGDLLMGLAGQLFATSGLPAAYLARARPLWSALARDLIAGECLEILRTGSPPDTVESLKVIRYKTAKYTVEQPLLIGGALAGAGDRVRSGYSAYGLPLGEAFQLRDDLLGLFGSPEDTGKANTDDLRGCRPTALLAETWRVADDSERRQLRAVLGRRDPGEEGLHAARELMRRLDAPGRIEKMITERVEEALTALDGLALPAPATTALTALAHSVAVRGA